MPSPEEDMPAESVAFVSNAMHREVRDVMTPGVVMIADDASIEQVTRALAAHRVHAVLVVGAHDARAVGWITARDLLKWVGVDRSIALARQAIGEKVTTIEPSAGIRAALYAMSLPGVTRLLVQRRPDVVPEGVVTDFDLAITSHQPEEERGRRLSPGVSAGCAR